jgi:hypothetical protein
MWRSLLAGLVTVGALVPLFIGSFGDPSAVFRDAPTASPVIQAPVRSAATQPEAQGAVAAGTPKPAEAPEQADEATLQQRRDALLQQLQDLQTKVAQAVQDTVSLRRQADQAWYDLDTLRKRRAGGQTGLDRAKEDAGQAAPAQQPTIEAERRIAPKEATADPGARDAQTSNPGSLTEIAPTTTESPPPTAERATPQQKPPAEPPQEVKPATPTPAAAPPPAKLAQPPAQPTVKPAPSEPDARAAVLARLRRQAPARGTASHVTSDEPPAPAPTEPPAAPPRQRLLAARTALAAGRVGDAEKLLQQAQIQLVLRPTTPSQDVSVTGSVAAGQVAEALSMLNAGNVQHAMHYINLAAAQADQGPAVAAMTAPISLMPR